MVGLTDNHHQRLIRPLRFSYHQISPKSLLFDPIIRRQLREVIFDEILKKSNNQLGILADDSYIFWGLNGDSLVLITSFIEPNHDLFVDIPSDGELTLASVTILLHCALYELIEFQLWDLDSFLE